MISIQTKCANFKMNYHLYLLNQGAVVETEDFEIKGEYGEIQVIQITKFAKDAYLIFRVNL